MNGVERIAKERERQIAEEGFTPERDITRYSNELAWAASCYAAPEPVFRNASIPGDKQFCFTDPWPWATKWDKRDKHSRIRQLEIAGALIAAEIDRQLLELEAEETGKILELPKE